MGAQEYNDKFAWENGFGGGLACEHKADPFAGLLPSSEAFVHCTRTFQGRFGLDVDGYFGPKTLRTYELAYGTPDLAVTGIDVSGWQHPDDYIQNTADPEELHLDELRDRGFKFGIIKALQGTGEMTRWCAEHTQNMLSHQWDFGHYQFVSPWTDFKDDSRAEAEAFEVMLAKLPTGTLDPSWDLESKGYTEKDGKCTSGKEMYNLWNKGGKYREEYLDRMTGWCQSYLERFRELFGRLPVLYTYPDFLRSRVRPEGLITECRLWLAAYTTQNPFVKYSYVPAVFRSNLVMQQFTSSGNAASRAVYNDDLDLNRALLGMGPLRMQ